MNVHTKSLFHVYSRMYDTYMNMNICLYVMKEEEDFNRKTVRMLCNIVQNLKEYIPYI